MFAESTEPPHWYAIQTRSRHEKVVRDQLAAKGITHLLPLWRKRSVWKDRIKVIEVPLFGGYLFCYFALQDRIAVLETVGVARIVGISGRPVPVPEEQIAAVRTMVEQRLPYDPHPYPGGGHAGTDQARRPHWRRRHPHREEAKAPSDHQCRPHPASRGRRYR